MSKADLAREPEPINFLVQVSQNVGVGHLTRSAAVARDLIAQGLNVQLSLISDAFGQKAAEALDIPFSLGLPTSTDLVVVDAIQVSDLEADWISSHDLRLVISPVFNRFDLASHVIVRDLPDSSKAAVPEGVDVVVDSSYAFVTSQDAVPKSCDYSELCVGVCLTGGADFIDVELLINSLASVHRLKELKLISNSKPNLQKSEGVGFFLSGFTDSPWDFLQPINVFIGGEGVMISESIARGIPAISLVLSNKANKNRYLSDAGSVKLLNRDPLDLESLVCLLNDVSALESMHQEAVNLALVKKQNSLSKKIAEIFSLLKREQHVKTRSYC